MLHPTPRPGGRPEWRFLWIATWNVRLGTGDHHVIDTSQEERAFVDLEAVQAIVGKTLVATRASGLTSGRYTGTAIHLSGVTLYTHVDRQALAEAVEYYRGIGNRTQLRSELEAPAPWVPKAAPGGAK